MGSRAGICDWKVAIDNRVLGEASVELLLLQLLLGDEAVPNNAAAASPLRERLRTTSLFFSFCSKEAVVDLDLGRELFGGRPILGNLLVGKSVIEENCRKPDDELICWRPTLPLASSPLSIGLSVSSIGEECEVNTIGLLGMAQLS